MKEKNRKAKASSQLLTQYAESAPLTSAEQVLLKQIDQADDQPPSLEDGLGLIDPQKRSKPTPPRGKKALSTLPKGGPIISPAARKCLLSLDEFIHKHRNEEIEIQNQMGGRSQLLGNLRWLHVSHGGPKTPSWQDSFPLKDLLTQWWIDEGNKIADQDSLVFYQALAVLSAINPHQRRMKSSPGWQELNTRRVHGKPLQGEIKYYGLLMNSLEWLIIAYPVSQVTDYLLDAAELCLRIIPRLELSRQPQGNQYYKSDWRSSYNLLSWLRTAIYHRDNFASDWETKTPPAFMGVAAVER